MVPPPPDLSDPAQLADYRRELRGVARGVRFGGVGVTVIGALAAAVRAFVWPALPMLVPVVLIALGVLLMLTAITLRTAYHLRRMKGEG